MSPRDRAEQTSTSLIFWLRKSFISHKTFKWSYLNIISAFPSHHSCNSFELRGEKRNQCISWNETCDENVNFTSRPQAISY